MGMDMTRDKTWQSVSAGRTLDQQLEAIRQDGSHGTGTVIRKGFLWGIGARKRKEKAENLLIFGCYVPFLMPSITRSYLDLLDGLGIDYTWLKREYCCGLPLIEQVPAGPEREKGEKAAKEFMETNLRLAKEMGARNMVYFCVWCAYIAKRFLGQDNVGQLYFPDIVIEKLEKRSLRIEPTVIGYYEGCHSRNRAFAPGIELDWSRYRSVLDKIEGLKVVDLRNTCCVKQAPRVVEEAEKLNLDTILCSCPACWYRLTDVAEGKARVTYLPTLLLYALGGRQESVSWRCL